MKEVLVVDDLSMLKALSNSYRIKIIDAFESKPATAKQISMKLGEPHSKVNYHIKALAKVGILELTEEVPKYGVIEKYYMPVAKTFVLDSKTVQGDDTAADSMSKAVSALFERIAKDFYQAQQNTKNFPKGEAPQKFVNYNGDYYLTQEEVNALNDQVNDLISDFLEAKRQKRDNTMRYSTATVIVPLDAGPK
jgi:DNA-binding transcriptional ArsR family regulator